MRNKKNIWILLFIILFLFFQVPVLAGGTETCDIILGESTDKYIKMILDILFWSFPVLTIIYTIIETLKAVTEGTVEAINIYIKRFAIRLVIIILVIITVPILDMIFTTFGLEYCIFR